jgi:hypothetical protein
VSRAWTHIGRLWTNGESFLALDANLLPHWRGLSDNTYQDVIVGLSWDVTSVPVGEGSAAFIATDPEVGDEGWLEVFESSEAIAVVQASPEDDSAYGATVVAALEHPEGDDERGDAVHIAGGRLVFLSAGLDGEGEDSPPLQAEEAEALPDTWPDLNDDDELAGLMLDVEPTTLRIQVRWRTELDSGVFARWLLVREPVQ